MRARLRPLFFGTLVLHTALACSVLTDYSIDGGGGSKPPADDASTDTATANDAPVTDDGPIVDAVVGDDGGPICAETTCITQAAAAGRTTCALTVTGEVWCWGTNNSGVVGAATNGSFPSPQKVAFSGSTPVDQVALGDWGREATTACARRSGAVECWGSDDTDRRLGRGGAEAGTFVNVPAPVLNVTGATDIALGAQRSCAIASAGVVCWGKDYASQIELAEPVPTSRPAVRIAGGRSHHVALLDNGDVMLDGYLYMSKETWAGEGGSAAGPGQNGYVPVLGVSDVVQIHSPSSFVCALTKLGKVSCWGRNSHGQLGRGTTGPYSTTPVEVTLPMAAKRIGGGQNHTCAVLVDESMLCWGRNSSGNDFNGTSSPRGQIGASPDGGIDPVVSTPRKMEGLPAGDPVRGITGGYDHTCAWTRSGALYCWGGNRNGQLGLGKYGLTTDGNAHPAPQKVLF